MIQNHSKTHEHNAKGLTGFTIIEVLIVLAIAGLIMLIVFLAVPALQRNSRNTQRRNDVGRVGSAVQEVITNNNGSIASVTNTNVQSALGTLSFYTGTNVTVGAVGSATVVNGTTTDTVNVHTNAVCAAMASGGGQGATSTGATARSIAVVYKVEPNIDSSRTCISI